MNWTLRLPSVFQFIGSEVYNIVDKTFPLPLLLKEGYVWFHAEACCSTELVEADAKPFWIGAAGPLGREG